MLPKSEQMRDTVNDKIEIYIRNSSAGTFLNLHIPSQMKEQIISAIQKGSLDLNDLAVTVELPVLPEWVSDREVRAKIAKRNERIHLSIPITSLNCNFTDE